MNKYLLNTHDGEVHGINESIIESFSNNNWIKIEYSPRTKVWTIYHSDKIVETIVKCKPWIEDYLSKSPRPLRFVSRSGDVRYSSVQECLNIISFVGNYQK